MKVRSGFVSNSSSSSFILYGVYEPDMSKLARKVMDYVGSEEIEKMGYDTPAEFVEAVADEPYILEEMPGIPVEIMNYDGWYVGVGLCVTRDMMLKGSYTEAELERIDDFLGEISTSKPSVHEGDYYC